MKVFFHFSVAGFSNTYLIGPDGKGDAIIVDPGTMNVPLLNMIEANDYYLRHVLLTHSHDSHVRGLRTLRKIYDFDVYAGMSEIQHAQVRRVAGGDEIQLGDVPLKIISIGGHSHDSLVFMMHRWLFTGDVLSAGAIGKTRNRYANELLISDIEQNIFGLEGDFLIFPGHGAPTTLEVERITNPSFASSQKK